MTVRLRAALLCATIAAAAAALASPPATAASAVRQRDGSIRFYDDKGFDAGYAWCLKQGGRFQSGNAECRYPSLAQCRAAIFNPPGGDCVPNPWTAFVTQPPGRPRQR